MKAILRLDCSPAGAAAHSSQVADLLIARLRQDAHDAIVLHRSLSATPPPWVDAGFLREMYGPPGPGLAESEALIAELEATDALVIATPMHNFIMPAVLKAWID